MDKSIKEKYIKLDKLAWNFHKFFMKYEGIYKKFKKDDMDLIYGIVDGLYYDFIDRVMTCRGSLNFIQSWDMNKIEIEIDKDYKILTDLIPLMRSL